VTTQNLCPVCETRIRKNAKFCTLHAAEHGMQFSAILRTPKPKSPNLCRFPGCRKPKRAKHNALYCSDRHCRTHFYLLQREKDPEAVRARQRQAAAKYRLSLGIKPRKATA
jgi:hypothetical protein